MASQNSKPNLTEVPPDPFDYELVQLVAANNPELNQLQAGNIMLLKIGFRVDQIVNIDFEKTLTAEFLRYLDGVYTNGGFHKSTYIELRTFLEQKVEIPRSKAESITQALLDWYAQQKIKPGSNPVDRIYPEL